MPIAGVLSAGAVIACTLLLGSVLALPHQSTGGARAADSGTARATWLLFADDLHLDFVRTGQLRDILKTAAATLREDDSLVGLRSSGPSIVSHAPSTNRTGLDAAIKRVAGNGLKASDVLGATIPGSTRELRYRVHTTLTALHTAVASLVSAPTPHKQILFISNGFAIVQPVSAPLSPSASQRPLLIDDDEILVEIATVAQAALDAGVTISALDPRVFIPGALDTLAVDEALWRSFVEASHHNLRELALATGGSLLDDNQPLTEVLFALRARTPR
jgi:hypothetical protein